MQGTLKRSVTTLRGGTLGYAEIVALKVIEISEDFILMIFFFGAQVGLHG